MFLGKLCPALAPDAIALLQNCDVAKPKLPQCLGRGDSRSASTYDTNPHVSIARHQSPPFPLPTLSRRWHELQGIKVNDFAAVMSGIISSVEIADPANT